MATAVCFQNPPQNDNLNTIYNTFQLFSRFIIIIIIIIILASDDESERGRKKKNTASR